MICVSESPNEVNDTTLLIVGLYVIAGIGMMERRMDALIVLFERVLLTSGGLQQT